MYSMHTIILSFSLVLYNILAERRETERERKEKKPGGGGGAEKRMTKENLGLDTTTRPGNEGVGMAWRWGGEGGYLLSPSFPLHPPTTSGTAQLFFWVPLIAPATPPPTSPQ